MGSENSLVRDATGIVSFSVGARERPKDTHPRYRGHMQLLSGEHGLLSEAEQGFESSECKDSRCLLEVPGETTERSYLCSLAWVYTRSRG